MGKNRKCSYEEEEEDLPEEILIQKILVRLPVVSLLRFKSVCKSWCALFQTSFFIDLHTTFFNSSSSKQLGGDTFILQASQGTGLDYETEFLVFSCEESAAAAATDEGDKKKSDEVVFKLDNLEHPRLRYNGSFIRRTDIAGSCNGLICLHDSTLYSDQDVFLWNPATRQSRILPKPPSLIDSWDLFRYLVGFGFDVKTKDYKVLLITYSAPKYVGSGQLEYLCKVEVYSLSTNSWRLLAGINSLPGVPSQGGSCYCPGIYMNGSYFFVGSKLSFESYSYENSLIISFDFTREIFTTMQFPLDHDYDAVQTQGSWYLRCLGGGGGGDKLALFAIRNYRKYEDCDIWVLNQHGMESWTKLHSFQIKKSEGEGEWEWTMPRGILLLNNGGVEFALLETRTEGKKKRKKKKMQLYNLITKEAKTDFLVCDWVKTVEVYKPSLVSIIAGNGAAAAADTVIGGAI